MDLDNIEGPVVHLRVHVCAFELIAVDRFSRIYVAGRLLADHTADSFPFLS